MLNRVKIKPNYENLLISVFPYTPRLGRRPVEDFCTEVLAWCLKSYDPFQKRFVKLLRSANFQALRLDAPVDVETQRSFSEGRSDDDDGEAEWAKPLRGRFDMWIYSYRNGGELIAIESKVESKLTVDQTHKYNRWLDMPQIRKRFRKRHLVTLTKWPKRLTNAPSNLKWSDVQRILEQLSRDSAAPFVIGQFAEFLRENGMAPLNMRSMNKTLTAGLANSLGLMSEMEDLLIKLTAAFRDDERFDKLNLKLFRKPKFEMDKKSRALWIGVYSRGTGYFYAGFRINQGQRGADASMWLEVGLREDQRRLKQKFSSELRTAYKSAHEWRRKWERNFDPRQPDDFDQDGKTYFRFCQPINSEHSGNPLRVLEWFQKVTKSIIRLAGKNFRA